MGVFNHLTLTRGLKQYTTLGDTISPQPNKLRCDRHLN
jgi:hypothetical protein